MDNWNKKILEDVKLKISISEFQKEEMENMKNNKKIIFKIAAIACCLLILTTGGVFAKDITNFIKSLFGANTSDGVDIAVNNGYVAEVQTEYQNSDGIEIKVDSILMDDFNFDINFNVKLGEKYSFKDFNKHHLSFEDLKVVDENGNIVFVTHSYNKNSEYKGAYSFLQEKISDKEFKVSLSATGNPELFPKSKHLKIEFTKITNFEYINTEQVCKVYEGNWEFDVDLPEKFYNRERITYNLKKCNYEDIDITEATLSNTAFRIKFTMPNNNILFDNEYVKTSNGKIFEPSRRSDGDGGYSVYEKDVVEYYQTFNLTSFDSTDDITVCMSTNTGEDIVIKLEKNKNN